MSLFIILSELQLDRKPLKSWQKNFNCREKKFRPQFYAPSYKFTSVLRPFCYRKSLKKFGTFIKVPLLTFNITSKILPLQYIHDVNV